MELPTLLTSVWTITRLTTLPENFFDHKDDFPLLDVWLTGNPIECLPYGLPSLHNPYLTFLPPKITFRVCGAASTVTLELSAPRISENGGSTTVRATLNRPSGATTTVTVSAAHSSPATSSDFELSTNTTLTIAAGETTSTGTVTITAVDNDRDEPDRTITVCWYMPPVQSLVTDSDRRLIFHCKTTGKECADSDVGSCLRYTIDENGMRTANRVTLTFTVRPVRRV